MRKNLNAGTPVVHEQMYDAYCKQLFSEKSILAWILHTAVDEYKGKKPEEIIPYIESPPQIGSVPVVVMPRIRGSNTEDSSVTEGTVFYDIHFRAAVPGTGSPVELIINVEAQARNSPGYALTKRALYYCARLLSAQKNVDFINSEYQNLKKVYSIWVVSRPPRRARNTITEYSIREQCRAGATRISREEYDMLKVVFLYLGSYEDEKAIPTLRLLDILHSDGLTDAEKKRRMREEFGIAITESIDKEVTEMCNWSQGIKEEYLTKGRREGRKEGRQEGIDIGEKRGRRLERQRSMQQIQLERQRSMQQVQLERQRSMQQVQLERQRSMQQVQLERQRTIKNLLSLGMSFEQAVEALGLKSPEDIEYLRTHV